MIITACKEVINPRTGLVYVPVFDPAWIIPSAFGIPNAKYRPALDVSFNDEASSWLLAALDFEREGGFLRVPIDDFLGRCKSYLEESLNDPESVDEISEMVCRAMSLAHESQKLGAMYITLN